MADPAPLTLLELPRDVLVQVLSHVDASSYSRVRLSCRRFCDALEASPTLNMTIREAAWASQPTFGDLLQRLRPSALRAQLPRNDPKLDGLTQACSMLCHLTLLCSVHEQASCLPALLQGCAGRLQTLRVKATSSTPAAPFLGQSFENRLPCLNVAAVAAALLPSSTNTDLPDTPGALGAAGAPGSTAAAASTAPGTAATSTSTPTAAAATSTLSALSSLGLTPQQQPPPQATPRTFTLPHLRSLSLSRFWLQPTQLLASGTTAPCLQEVRLQQCTLDVTECARQGVQLGRAVARTFPALQLLGLQGCEARCAPEGGVDPTREWLDVPNTDLFEGMQALTKTLRTLDVTKMSLGTVPPQIFHLTGLSHLRLEETQISVIHETISVLSHLTALTLKANDLETLPPTLNKLTGLCVMDVRGNARMQGLPKVLAQMPNLKQLLTDWRGRPQGGGPGTPGAVAVALQGGEQATEDWVWADEGQQEGHGVMDEAGPNGGVMQRARARQAPLAMNHVDLLLAQAVGFMR